MTLTLYGRTGCHLCTDMAAELQPILTGRGLALRIVDVDADAELAARFGARVPVLALGEEEICHYFLDPDALERLLTRKTT